MTLTLKYDLHNNKLKQQTKYRDQMSLSSETSYTTIHQPWQAFEPLQNNNTISAEPAAEK